MPCLIYELDETYATITRPVALSITKQLIRNLEITRDIPIWYPGANGKLTTWNASTEESQDSANFNTQEKVVLNVKEEYLEDDLLTMYNEKFNNLLIMYDKLYNIQVYPVYTRTKVTLSFTYRTRDRYQAEAFRDNWRRKIAMNRNHMVFFAEYTYPIPKVIENIVHLLYLKRKTYRREYNSYKDYILGMSSDRVTIMSNRAGKEDLFAVEESQQEIFGNFNDAIPPEAEKDEKGAVWTVQFDYEFHYDKPISVGVRYPLLIDNQLVDPVLFPATFVDVKKVAQDFQTMDRYHFDKVLEQMGYLSHVQGAYIRIPEFDDWSNRIQWDQFRPLVAAMLIVDRETPRDICNLKDLGEYGLHDALVPSFKENHLYLNRRYEFPFYISLYKGDVEMDMEDIYIDYELNVTSKSDMSIFKEYHLVIHLLKDIKKLSYKAQERFFKNPQLVMTWLDIMLGKRPVGGYPKVNKAGWVDVKSFREICERNYLAQAADERRFIVEGPGRLISTVGAFTINAGPL